jgi:hypothetical protein
MSVELPEPPATLPTAPRAFYKQLRRMLDVVRPTRIDPDKVSVAFGDDGLEISLAHADRQDWLIWATVGERDAIVGTAWAHEHFSAPPAGVVEQRPWTTEIVDFIAEILRGEIEIETTFRGDTPVTVKHFNRDEHGQRSPLGHTGFLTPARFLFWRRKRAETEQASFL